MTFVNAVQKQKFWQGQAPAKCDVCHRPIAETFVDGKTRMGPWAIMCHVCFRDVGVGLGIGLGQIYTLVKETSHAGHS